MLTEKLLSFMHDVEYRVRRLMCMRTNVFFQTWDGHHGLFRDVWYVHNFKERRRKNLIGVYEKTTGWNFLFCSVLVLEQLFFVNVNNRVPGCGMS